MADNLETIYCPACGKKMSKIYAEKQNVYLDICLDGCGGIYFDNRELKKFDEQTEDIQPIIDAYKDKTFKSVDTSETRICPVCNATMVKNFVSIKQEIEIDECYCCGGKFLDYGELEKMRAQYESEDLRQLDFIKQASILFETRMATEGRQDNTMQNYNEWKNNQQEF